MLDDSNALPTPFIERLKSIVSHEKYTSVLQSFSQKKPIIFRLNTLKCQDHPIVNELHAKPIKHFQHTFQIEPVKRELLTHSKAFKEGLIYIQNLSSMLAPLVLDPQPDEEILDLTAAPGSKTTQMAALMNNTGRIAAVEKVRSRFFKLKDNCERQGTTNVEFYCKDGATVWRSCENRFDRVLLDAPCSSEGRFNTSNPETFHYWNLKKVKEMSRKQWPLLYSAFRCLKPGGTLVYSTCTFGYEENERQIEKLIKKFGEQVVIEKIELPLSNIQKGMNSIHNAIRILPDDVMDGFFICRVKKSLHF